jgi:hypothetical protein
LSRLLFVISSTAASRAPRSHTYANTCDFGTCSTLSKKMAGYFPFLKSTQNSSLFWYPFSPCCNNMTLPLKVSWPKQVFYYFPNFLHENQRFSGWFLFRMEKKLKIGPPYYTGYATLWIMSKSYNQRLQFVKNLYPEPWMLCWDYIKYWPQTCWLK